MISKELLSEVLGEEVDFIKSGFNGTIGTENQYKYRIKHKPQVKYINIYELAHKCKEWAEANGYGVDVLRYKDRPIEADVTKHEPPYNYPNECFKAKTEPEAVFNACEWIKDNK